MMKSYEQIAHFWAISKIIHEEMGQGMAPDHPPSIEEVCIDWYYISQIFILFPLYLMVGKRLQNL